MDDRVSGMAERFMASWQSDIFRSRCVAQIESVRSQITPNEESEDAVEKFIANNNSQQLEEFVFDKSKTREDYMSMIADMMMMLRKHAGKSLVDMSVLQNATSGALAAQGISDEDAKSIASNGQHSGDAGREDN